MKRFLKYSGFLLLTLVLATSCDDTNVGGDEELDYNTLINVVTFKKAALNAPAVADGEIKTYNAAIFVAGPNVGNIDGDITVKFSVDPSSTAVEGVNYTLASNSITLTKSSDYLGNIPIQIITEGIVPPLNLTLVLNIDSVTTNVDNVVVSGNKKQAVITIGYSCFANLEGTYSMNNDIGCSRLPVEVTISPNAEGGWYISTADGGLLQFCSANNIQNDGNIFVVCGEVLESEDVAYCGSNGIGCILGGSWDPDAGANGVLTLTNGNTFFGFAGAEYTSTYTRQ